MNTANRKPAFTVIELLTAIAISAVAGTIFVAALTWGLRLVRVGEGATTLQAEGSLLLDQIARDIRGATDVVSATNTTLTIDVYPRFPSEAPQRIRFFVQEGELKRGLTPPQGEPPQYPSANETFRTLAKHVAAGGFTLRYMNEDGIDLGLNPSVGSIALIEFSVRLEDRSMRNPQVLNLEGKAQMRNRKTNL